MKRFFKKILATIVAIAILVVILLKIYNSFNIDPRIWFFIVFGTVMILIFIVPSTVFLNDLNKLQEYIKTHTFQEFYEEYLEKYSDKLKKYKTKTEEIRKKIARL